MSERVKFWYGSKGAYNSITNKDDSTLYCITNIGNECIYKGSILIAEKIPDSLINDIANHTVKIASLEEALSRKVEVKFDDSTNTLIFYK